ncbi:hypothetical protein VNO78_30776 [Psophocarpus tetragonolobus]|uniref:Protein kinase domain-containing protein n=1 Tax=Psophocarpus tetragonolobus TaxID=3891 RepID=A0AAN9RX88_PSOTE
MPFWWKRCQIVAQDSYNQQQSCRRNEGEKSNVSKTRIVSKRQNIEKAKSFEETVLVSHRFYRAFTLPNRPSSYEIFHSEKQVYPLPQPSRSLELASVKFDSEPASSSSSPSGSSDSTSLGVDVSEDHRDFASFIAYEESECDSSLTIQHKESETFASEKLIQHPQHSETSADLQNIKDENWKHLCHPLPLPPYGLSQHLQSKWIKGRLLGKGSFGHVYAGFNGRGKKIACFYYYKLMLIVITMYSINGQLCAIKEMKPICEDQNSEAYLKEMNQEVELLSQLSHRNIVQYYGSELRTDNGKEKLSLYLEYVSGGSIYKLLQEYGPFKESLIRSYTMQILHALAYLHARNTIHRNIKGSNILVDSNAIIKLTDFGMAKNITSTSFVHSFEGSTHWTAPEVILNTSSVGLAVDVWSLGCTVIEMATTKPPWSNYKGVAAVFKTANSNDYQQIPSHLSKDAQNFLKLCLQRDPFLRPSATQLLQHPFIQDS